MEVEQENSNDVGSVKKLEQDKEAANLNSSEDEGIFVSHHPTHVSQSPNVENRGLVTDSVNELNSINQEPSESPSRVTKAGAFMLDDDSEDDAIKSLSFGRRKITLSSDDEDFGQSRFSAIHRPSSTSSDEEESNDLKIKKPKKKRIVQRVDSDSDEDMELFRRKVSPEKPKVIMVLCVIVSSIDESDVMNDCSTYSIDRCKLLTR